MLLPRIAAGLVVLVATHSAAGQAPSEPPGGTLGGLPRAFRPFEFPQPGQVLSAFLQDQLKLTAQQKKQLAELQKTVDSQLAKTLTAEQRKTLNAMRPGRAGFGPPGGPPGGFGPPRGFGPPGGGGPRGVASPGGLPGGFGGPFGGSRMEEVRTAIAATAEEWLVIEPKLQKVLSARRVLASEPRPDNPFGGAFGGAFGGGQTTNVLAQPLAELKAVLNNPKRTQADVDVKIAAVRKARQRARADLDAAQKDLLLLLTESQQATLVSLGHLE